MTDRPTRPRILVAEPKDFSTAALALLRSAADVDLRECAGDDLTQAFSDYDAVWLRLAHRVTSETLGKRPRCRVLAIAATGLDHIDVEACGRRGVRVVSLKGETSFLRGVRATAELAVALTLALLRHLVAAAESVRSGAWDRDRFRGHELFEKTAGIVGVGRLGSLVAGYLGAFGMRVIGYDPRPDFPDRLAERVARLDDLLSDADVVSLHVTYDPSTRNLIGARELALMKRSAVLVNTSRGGVIDERALLEALEQKRIAGAALDVLAGEPEVATDHPLVAASRRLDNLLIVPHIGGNTIESFAKTELFVAARVVEALEMSR